MLQYISTTIWKQLFGKPSDSLEKVLDKEDEFMIHEFLPVTNTFISLPQDYSSLNCAAFLAGILAGILDSSKFVSQDVNII